MRKHSSGKKGHFGYAVQPPSTIAILVNNKPPAKIITVASKLKHQLAQKRAMIPASVKGVGLRHTSFSEFPTPKWHVTRAMNTIEQRASLVGCQEIYSDLTIECKTEIFTVAKVICCT